MDACMVKRQPYLVDKHSVAVHELVDELLPLAPAHVELKVQRIHQRDDPV